MSRLKKYLASGALMTAVTLALRGLSVIFNSYISKKIGAEALGLYTLLGSVYSFALTLALSGINLTTTRLVSDALGEESEIGVRTAMKKCICYALFFGISASVALIALSEPLGVGVLGDARTVKPLRLCGATLPLISLSSCFNGYFTAVRRVYKNAAVQMIEQLARLGFCVAMLDLFFGNDIESACTALVLGGALAEMLSFSVSLLFFVFERNKRSPKRDIEKTVSERKMAKKMLSIALPLAFSTYFRSALLTLEHTLIPIGIEKSGANRAQSLAAYGTLQAMVMPLVLLPAALIQSFSGLLIPELAELKIQNNKEEIRYVASRVCHLALVFATGAAGIMIFFADGLGEEIYSSSDAAKYIRVLSHIVPIMYLDTTVDSMLKGLGEQLYTMNVNIVDTLCSLVMVWILIPKMGIYGYIMLIMISEVFNASLSILKLVKVTGIKIKLGKWFLKPAISVFLGVSIGSAVGGAIGSGLFLQISLSIVLYFAFVRLFGAINREECAWIRSFFRIRT